MVRAAPKVLQSATTGEWVSSRGECVPLRRVFGRRSIPLRRHLLWLSLLIAGPAIAFSSFLLYQSLASTRQQLEDSVQRAARGLADDIDRDIQNRILLLRTLATSRNLQSGALSEFHRQANDALTDQLSRVVLFTADLKPVLNSAVEFGRPLPPSENAVAAEVVRTRTPQVSDLFTDPVQGTQSLSVAVPIIRDGTVRYVLMLVFDASRLVLFLEAQHPPKGWVTGISDRGGKVISRLYGQDDYVGKSLSPEILERSRRETGVFRTRNLAGQEVLRAVAFVPSSGWMVAATVEEAYAFAPARRSWILAAVAGLGLLGVAVALSSAYAYFIAQANARLLRYSRSLATGSFPASSPSGIAEIDEIAGDLRAGAMVRASMEAAVRESEERFRMMAESAPVMLWMGDEVGKCIYLNRQLREFWGVEGGALATFDWSATLHAEDIAQLSAQYMQAMERRLPFTVEARYRRADGIYRVLRTEARPRFDHEGTFLGMIGVNADVTDIQAAQRALRDKEHRLRMATSLARLGVFEWQIARDTAVWENERMYEIFQRETSQPPLGQREFIDSYLHEADRAGFRAAMARKFSVGETVDRTLRITLPSGETRWLEVSGYFDGDEGAPTHIIGVVDDVTEQREAERRLRFLMGEVNHRSKNMLAVVQAVVRQTATTEATADFAARFSERIGGLAASLDLLAESEWKGVQLSELVASQLQAFGGLMDSRIHCRGASIQLRAAAAQAIGMALHELATNAGKYGALSNNDGSVNVAWSVVADKFIMEWRESGGPPVVPPKRRSFGHLVIVNMAQHAVDGTVELNFDPHGVSWLLVAPIASVLENVPSHASLAAE